MYNDPKIFYIEMPADMHYQLKLKAFMEDTTMKALVTGPVLAAIAGILKKDEDKEKEE